MATLYFIWGQLNTSSSIEKSSQTYPTVTDTAEMITNSLHHSLSAKPESEWLLKGSPAPMSDLTPQLYQKESNWLC